MRWMRNGLFILVMTFGLLVVARVSFAMPGEITVVSGAQNFTTYSGSSNLNGSIYTAHSPIQYTNNENRFKIHLDKYRYKFRNLSNTSFYFGIAKITPSFPNGSTIYSMILNNYSSYSNYLDGDYYIYMYDYSGNNYGFTDMINSVIEITAVTPGEVRIEGPDSFSYSSDYAAGIGSSYLLKGNTYTIRAYVEGAPTSVVATVTDSQGTTQLGALTYDSSLQKYVLDYTFNSHFEVSSTVKPTLKIQANYQTSIKGVSTTVDARPIYVTEFDALYYQRTDTTWFYTSPILNSFAGPSRSNLLCYDFVTDNLTPNYAGGPPQQGNDPDIKDFMKRQGAHASRPGTVYTTASDSYIPYADAIYYTNYHFAKVTKWDSNGYPTEIVSKWGGLELVKSTSPAPFSGPVASYGTPHIYFKK